MLCQFGGLGGGRGVKLNKSAQPRNSKVIHCTVSLPVLVRCRPGGRADVVTMVIMLPRLLCWLGYRVGAELGLVDLGDLPDEQPRSVGHEDADCEPDLVPVRHRTVVQHLKRRTVFVF